MSVLRTRGTPAASPAALAHVAAALDALDPFSFWVVPAGRGTAGDLVVIGSTGAFLIGVRDAEGRLDHGRGTPTIAGRPIQGLRGLRAAAKRVSASLRQASVFTDVEPVVCLTDAVVGAPFTSKGVRVVHVRDLAHELSARPRTLERGRIQRGARALGMSLAGDDRRHFTAS
jgi:hypothetical protein